VFVVKLFIVFLCNVHAFTEIINCLFVCEIFLGLLEVSHILCELNIAQKKSYLSLKAWFKCKMWFFHCCSQSRPVI